MWLHWSTVVVMSQAQITYMFPIPVENLYPAGVLRYADGKERI